jgi:exodeoxyribonuclease-3
MKLRIVSWNCNMALYQKFDRLLSLRPDVAVIQECASPERDAARRWRPPCTGRDWVGFNADKGLGIFTFGGLQVRRHRTYSDAFSVYLPVQISGRCQLNLLGLWRADERRIPPGAVNDPRAALHYYRRFLTAAPSVVAGDFNLLPQQMSQRTGQPAHGSIVELAARAGLRDAGTIPIPGSIANTLRATHYHQRKPSRGFVVDYIFVPRRETARLAAFEVGDPHDWLQWSDHVPLVVEFALTRASSFAAWFDRTAWMTHVARLAAGQRASHIPQA